METITSEASFSCFLGNTELALNLPGKHNLVYQDMEFNLRAKRGDGDAFDQGTAAAAPAGSEGC